MRPLRLITFGADAGTVVARARGVFAGAEIALELTETPNSTVQMRGLWAGRVRRGVDGVRQRAGLVGARRGPAIVSVLQPNAGQMLPLYVRPEITGWADLKGKPLAADAVDTAFALVLRRILLAHDLDLDRGDYSLVAEGNTQARLASMQRGATYAGMMSTQLEAQAQAAGWCGWPTTARCCPTIRAACSPWRARWGESHRDLVVDFLRAWLEAAGWVRANRAAAIELVAREQKTTPGRRRKAWTFSRRTVPLTCRACRA